MTDDPLDDLPASRTSFMGGKTPSIDDVSDFLSGHVPPEKREPTKLVGVDDRGNRIGEDHPRAKISDHEVELIRELWDTRDGWGGSIGKIAEKFELSKSTVHDIVTFKKRASYPTGWRRVKVVVAGHERVGGVSLVQRDILFHPGTKREADND